VGEVTKIGKPKGTTIGMIRSAAKNR